MELLFFALAQIFLDAKLYDAADERKRERLVEMELNRSFRSFVAGQLLLERGDRRSPRVEADVAFEGRKPYQHAVQGKGRNAVANLFFRLGRSLFDGQAHLLQALLHFFWETIQVIVKVLRRLSGDGHCGIMPVIMRKRNGVGRKSRKRTHIENIEAGGWT